LLFRSPDFLFFFILAAKTFPRYTELSSSAINLGSLE
jgi:hypothetical protein